MMLKVVPLPAAGPNAPDLAAEANHRIANSLSILAVVVQMQKSSICKDPRLMSSEEVCAVLENIRGRLDAVARLHHLLANSQSQGPIEVSGYLRGIAEAVVSSISSAAHHELHFASDPGCVVAPEKALSLGLIVGELVTNAVKYSHPAGIGGLITLACRHGPEGHLTIEVSDDGVGMPDGFDPMKHGHLGFKLIRSLANQLAAEITFHNDALGLGVALQI
jgi:two-component sensor histidine kinase